MLHAEVYHRLCGNQSGRGNELAAGRNRAHCSTPATAAVYSQELYHAAHQSHSPLHGLHRPGTILAAADILARPPCQHKRECLAAAVTCTTA